MAAYSYCIITLFLISPLNCYAGNVTNIFDIRDEYNTVKRYVAIILFSLLLLYGIVSNILLIIVFCSKNTFYSHAFILISSQLIICAFLNFIPQVTIVLFEMIKTEITEAHNKTWIHNIFATLDTFSFIAMLHFAFLLAINRFVAISWQKFNGFFQSIKFYFLIACVWLSVLVISLLEFHYCIKTFNVSNLGWSINCTKKTPESGAIFLKFVIRYIWTLALPIAMFAIYIPIFYNMRRKQNCVLELRKTNECEKNDIVKIRKYEWLMSIQAAVVCGAIEIEIICFYFLPQFALKIAGEAAEIPVNIFVNCFIIFSHTVLPTANLIFIKRFRDDIKHAFIDLLSKFKNNYSCALIRLWLDPNQSDVLNLKVMEIKIIEISQDAIVFHIVYAKSFS
uniref:G_PROTEIN_RECEP_F1_2 domain-containing protein n=1 Tax=Onchocerca volvulus TaxID=6282 RepID=A0A8R1XNK0_ONCVO